MGETFRSDCASAPERSCTTITLNLLRIQDVLQYFFHVNLGIIKRIENQNPITPLAVNKRPHVLNYAKAVNDNAFEPFRKHILPQLLHIITFKIVFIIGDRYRYFCTIYRTSSPA